MFFRAIVFPEVPKNGKNWKFGGYSKGQSMKAVIWEDALRPVGVWSVWGTVCV